MTSGSSGASELLPETLNLRWDPVKFFWSNRFTDGNADRRNYGHKN